MAWWYDLSSADQCTISGIACVSRTLGWRRGPAGPRGTPGSWRAETGGAHLPKASPIAVFGSAKQAAFPHGQSRTADSLVATLATRAGMLVMSAHDRESRLSEIRAFLAGRPETAEGEFISRC